MREFLAAKYISENTTWECGSETSEHGVEQLWVVEEGMLKRAMVWGQKVYQFL